MICLIVGIERNGRKRRNIIEAVKMKSNTFMKSPSAFSGFYSASSSI